MIAVAVQSIELDVTNVSAWLLAGKILSGVALAVVLAVVVNIWRRPSFPAVGYGSIELSHSRMRWLWFGFIVGAVALGSTSNPVALLTSTSEDEELLAAATSRRQTSLDMPLPFYRYQRERVYADDELAVDNVTESILLPWSLLSALLAYVVLVVRWNPQNRLALRILQGRKRRSLRRRSKP